ncbi:MAG TPA: methyltransferase domain-containing protein [Chloroflexota bacterium]
MPVISLRQRTDRPELLDGPLQADSDLAGNLRDLARINRWTGGDLLYHRALGRLLRGSPGPSFSLLDVGGGRGDGVARVVTWAAHRQRECRGILLDRSTPILQLANSQCHCGVRVLQGDGCRLPLRDHSVDVAGCSLLLHHFSPDLAVVVIREMARVARIGVIVDDLLRSRVGYVGARLLGALLTSNRLTRHDGPLSVRRAYRRPELAALLRRAGIRPVCQLTIPGYRSVVAGVPDYGAQP